MSCKFTPLLLPEDAPKLIEFMTTQDWPFHRNLRWSETSVRELIDEGFFDGTNHSCFWIGESSADLGLLRIFDLDDVDDGSPLFDLRLRPEARGKGIGTAAVRWLSDLLFAKYPDLHRIMGTTRSDNLPMQKVFVKCGFVKEGHFRKDWPGTDGQRYDTVHYGLLREDWAGDA